MLLQNVEKKSCKSLHYEVNGRHGSSGNDDFVHDFVPSFTKDELQQGYEGAGHVVKIGFFCGLLEIGVQNNIVLALKKGHAKSRPCDDK